MWRPPARTLRIRGDGRRRCCLNQDSEPTPLQSRDQHHQHPAHIPPSSINKTDKDINRHKTLFSLTKTGFFWVLIKHTRCSQKKHKSSIYHFFIFFPVNGTGKVTYWETISFDWTNCYQSVTNGPFSLSWVMIGLEIEGKAGLCKSGRSMLGFVTCTVAYTSKPRFQSQLVITLVTSTYKYSLGMIHRVPDPDVCQKCLQ